MQSFTRWFVFASIVVLGLAFAAQPAAAQPTINTVEQSFSSPPNSAKPHTWWHWMNGNVTREGITRDLEEMQRVGLGGFMAFHVTDRFPAGPVDYFSSEWHELMTHTIQEAGRLDLEVCFHICAGWSSSGGPWITPEYAMQEIVWSERPFSPNGATKHPPYILPTPEHRLNYYRDIAVLAFPTLSGENSDNEGFRIRDFRPKAGFSREDTKMNPDTRAVKSGDVIQRDQIINLTDLMDADGTLQWTIPPGNWTVVRFGYTPTGVGNHPSPPEGLGLECDKLNPEAADVHWNNSVQKIIADAGPLAGTVLNSILVDSYEVAHQNWTHRFAQEFKNRRGYDIIPYLPVITGRVIDTLDKSERFLWDFRRTIADLFTDYYFGRFAELCRKNGLVYANEPYGRNGGFDQFTAASRAELPMGEFWVGGLRGRQWSAKLASSAAHTWNRKFVGAEAFTAAPPASGWQQHPYTLKVQGDYFYTLGINRFIFHSNAHQPWSGVLPGMTMGPHGIQMNRNNTWWPQATAWMSYLTRCQYLLQEGKFVADLCYYAGEQTPNFPLNREEMNPSPPAGYDYDFCDTELLMQMSVRNGQLTLPSGMQYRALVLPVLRELRPSVLQKILALAEAGAAIVGPKTEKAPGLANYPRSDTEVQQLADKLWGNSNGTTVTRHAMGNGVVYWNRDLSAILKELGQKADFECTTDAVINPTKYPGPGIEYIHRRIDNADVYFISNQHHVAKTLNAVFRVTGKTPEFWYPKSGRTEPATIYSSTADGRTRVQVPLEPAGSVFVVFRNSSTTPPSLTTATLNGKAISGTNPSSKIQMINEKLRLLARQPGKYELTAGNGRQAEVDIDQLPDPLTLNGPWQLNFPAGWGAPEQIEIPRLISWTDHQHPEIQHFSGTASYAISFDVTAGRIHDGMQAMLDLGDVQVIAEVSLNDRDLGILWKPPFQIDVTDLLKTGVNRLQVKVTNLWPNRLIGDEQYPQLVSWVSYGRRLGNGIEEIPDWLLEGKPMPATKRKTFATWKFYSEDSPLLPSGLLGPVQIHWGEEREIVIK
jgi:hypothetical protein